MHGPIIGAHTDREAIGYGRFGATAIDSYSRAMDDLELIEETSIDFYAALRSGYYQNRQSEIWRGRDHRRYPGDSSEPEGLFYNEAAQ